MDNSQDFFVLLMLPFRQHSRKWKCILVVSKDNTWCEQFFHVLKLYFVAVVKKKYCKKCLENYAEVQRKTHPSEEKRT
jgi:hypothetical protein